MGITIEFQSRNWAWRFVAMPITTGHVVTATRNDYGAGMGETDRYGGITRGLSGVPPRIRELLSHHLYVATVKGYTLVQATVLPNGDRGTAMFAA